MLHKHYYINIITNINIIVFCSSRIKALLMKLIVKSVFSFCLFQAPQLWKQTCTLNIKTCTLIKGTWMISKYLKDISTYTKIGFRKLRPVWSFIAQTCEAFKVSMFYTRLFYMTLMAFWNLFSLFAQSQIKFDVFWSFFHTWVHEVTH